jgi:hypothetical protein
MIGCLTQAINDLIVRREHIMSKKSIPQKRKIGRSSVSGKFVSKKEVKAHPESTTEETVVDHAYSDGCCDCSKEKHG